MRRNGIPGVPEETEMAKLGVGIVGCGRNGGNHARVWSTIEEAAIVGVYDVNDAAAAERAGELGVRAFASLEELVAEPAVEAVDVVTSGSHRDTAVIAAEAGKHVMVENPFSVTVQEADDMIAAAERSGINLMYAQTWRFMPYGSKTRQLIEAGEIGDPVSITAAFITERVRRGLLWHRQLSQGGGFFMYEGTHFFDQVKWLMGSEIETVYAAGLGTYLLEGDGEDNGLATYRFENGTFGTLHNGSSNPGARIAGWTIVGTGGIIDVKDETVRLGKGDWKTVPTDGVNGFEVEFREFMASIAEGRTPSCDGYDGRRSTAAAAAVRESHETGLPVRISA